MAICQRLESLQGKQVPVFLRTVDLRTLKRIYDFNHRVYVIYRALLSWGGNVIDKVIMADGAWKSATRQTVRSVRAIHQLGVAHADIRSANVLFDPITLGPPRTPLGVSGDEQARREGRR